MASLALNRAGAADQAIVAIVNNSVREKLMMRLVAVDFDLATVVHPAIVSPSAVLGAGFVVRRCHIGHRSPFGRGFHSELLRYC